MDTKKYLSQLSEDLRNPDDWLGYKSSFALVFKKGARSYKLRVDLGRVFIDDFELSDLYIDDYFSINKFFLAIYNKKYKYADSQENKIAISEIAEETFKRALHES